MSVQRALEIGIVSGAVKSKAAMKAAVKQLNGYQFKDLTLAWVWEKCRESWTKGELIRLSSLEGKAMAEPENVQTMILETIVEVWTTTPSAAPLTDLDTLRTYHRSDSMVKGMDRAAKAIARGDVDGAGAMLGRVASDAAPQNHLEIKSVIDFDDWSEASATQGILTGLRTYDDVTMGGPRPEDVGVIFGVTNMGKSILATNFGYNGFKHRRRTLHIDSENGLQEVRVRYAARAKRVPSRGLTRRGLDYSEDFRHWAETNQSRIHDHLRLLPIGVQQSTMEEVEAKIAEVCEDGWPPELILFDTPDHVVWRGSMDNAGMIAMMQYGAVKRIAQRYKAVVWVVTQAKAEAEGKIATNKHAAWGYDKARLADSVLTINPGLDDNGRPLSEREMGDSRCLFVGKARKSAGRFIIPLKTELSTAYITEELPGDRAADD
jgi:KaiC/GvpD/RAD55 family RecA-like ATPase